MESDDDDEADDDEAEDEDEEEEEEETVETEEKTLSEDDEEEIDGMAKDEDEALVEVDWGGTVYVLVLVEAAGATRAVVGAVAETAPLTSAQSLFTVL